MFYFYIVLSIILSLCIIILCLMQHSQKDNTSGIAFSNSTFQEVMGITETKNTISRLTLLFIFMLFFLCILAYRDKSRNLEIPDIDYEKLKIHNVSNIDKNSDTNVENVNEENGNNEVIINNNDNNQESDKAIVNDIHGDSNKNILDSKKENAGEK